MPQPPTVEKPSFRPEIQGLRAIASLLVAIFHVWLGRVSGGVDVFFVASGYLMTTSLMKPLLGPGGRVAGGVQFLTFWARLAKRLLPASLFVLAAVLGGMLLFLPQTRWWSVIREIVASTLYVENWQLALDAVDYLDRENALSPIQHYWALSVQGQFYLLWPIVVQSAVRIARRFELELSKVLAPTIATIFTLSLAYSIHATARNQPFAYFDSLARIWEFSIGGILALSLPKWSPSPIARTVLGWIGLLAILSCGLILQVSTVFPGYAALWPTLGAALVLVGGGSSGSLSAGRLLSSRPLTYLGDVSYAFYLWHWPILVFYRTASRQTRLGLLEGAVILGLSLLAAIATTRWVESPLRHGAVGRQRPARVFLFGLLGVAPVLAASGALGGHILHERANAGRAVTSGNPDYPGPLAMVRGFVYGGATKVPIQPSFLAISGDLPLAYRDDCHQTLTDDAPLTCTYGAPDASKTMALVGGSHSTQWLPALEAIAARDAWRIVTFTKSGCLFELSAKSASTSSGAAKPNRTSCSRWNANVLAALLELKPDMVVTTGTKANGRERLLRGSVHHWEELTEAGAIVVAIRDNPWMNFDVAECVEREGSASPKCARTRDEMLAKVSPLRRFDPPPRGVRFVDLTDYFCTETTCLPVIGNVLVYRDKHHVSATYARMLAPYLEAQMFPGARD